jgi:hypothetical protein
MKQHFLQTFHAPMRITVTCMVVGPFIGVLALYLAFLGIGVWVSLSHLLSSVPTTGGPMVGMLLGTLFLLLPLFAVVGAAVVALQTLLTGVVLSIVNHLKVPEKMVRLAPLLPLTLMRFAVAFAVGLAVSFAVSPSQAPQQFKNLGPLSLQFAAALSTGICYLIALRWSAGQTPRSSLHEVAHDGA